MKYNVHAYSFFCLAFYKDFLANILSICILQVIVEKLQPPSSHTVQFFSFKQDWGSRLNSEEGREKLREVGIETVADVGEWLVGVFRDRFDQEELALRLESFIHEKES